MLFGDRSFPDRMFVEILRKGRRIEHVLRAESAYHLEKKLKRSYPDGKFEILTVSLETER